MKEIVQLHGVPFFIVLDQDPRFTACFLGEFPASHGDTVDVEQCFSSPNRRSIREDHPDVRGHDIGMCPSS